MDWLDVGMTNIDKALDELKSSDGLETCMKFYQYICCIDIVWGGICQLHRVFINRDTKPFENDSSAFQMKYFREDDNCYFKEIRSCFGAHPVELKTKKKNKKQEVIRKFASWSCHYGTSNEMSVLLYNNIPDSRFEKVTVTVDELKNFYETRCQYIQQIIDAIDNIAFDYKKEMQNSVIPKSNDLIEQIIILKNASQQRFGGGILVEELEQIERFLTTNFSCKKNKDAIEAFIAEYNESVEEIDELKYTDMIGILMSSISTIIDVISYVLIAFVGISLVVSSIMIGIITNISVLERTKEIGILRAVGASKKDVSRVFNAETLIVGFGAGLIGIIVTVILNIPISLIIKHLADISGLSTLPVAGGIILVIISMVLTLVSGLIPSRIAAKKDPVESLRSE
jgi:ABC-type antimicrobial peptide transport system permease subunit